MPKVDLSKEDRGAKAKVRLIRYLGLLSAIHQIVREVHSLLSEVFSQL
jgi:hypothetical protein